MTTAEATATGTATEATVGAPDPSRGDTPPTRTIMAIMMTMTTDSLEISCE